MAPGGAGGGGGRGSGGVPAPGCRAARHAPARRSLGRAAPRAGAVSSRKKADSSARPDSPAFRYTASDCWRTVFSLVCRSSATSL